jgi:hypothetical protein
MSSGERTFREIGACQCEDALATGTMAASSTSFFRVTVVRIRRNYASAVVPTLLVPERPKPPKLTCKRPSRRSWLLRTAISQAELVPGCRRSGINGDDTVRPLAAWEMETDVDGSCTFESWRYSHSTLGTTTNCTPWRLLRSVRRQCAIADGFLFSVPNYAASLCFGEFPLPAYLRHIA